MFEQRFEEAIKKLADFFNEDKVKPSITTSYLGEKKIYMSVIRYKGRTEKKVVTSATAETASEALQLLGERFGQLVDAKAITPKWPED